MKNKNLFLIFFTMMNLFCSPNTYAGEALIKWGDACKFTDVQPSSGNINEYILIIEKTLTDEFSLLAKKLPNGINLYVEIQNIDLAGNVSPILTRGGYYPRLMQDIYYPVIIISYKIDSIDDVTLLEGKRVVIKDMNYLRSAASPKAEFEFYYETRMINEWFERDILSNIEL